MHMRGRGPNRYAPHTGYEPSPKLRKRNPPLRTFRELCEDLCINPRHLSRALGEEGAPKPKFHHVGVFTTSNRWYDPVEVRRWWKSRSTGSTGETE